MYITTSLLKAQKEQGSGSTPRPGRGPSLSGRGVLPKTSRFSALERLYQRLRNQNVRRSTLCERITTPGHTLALRILERFGIFQAENATILDIREELGIAAPIDDGFELGPGFIVAKMLAELVHIDLLGDSMVGILLQVAHDVP